MAEIEGFFKHKTQIQRQTVDAPNQYGTKEFARGARWSYVLVTSASIS